MGWTSGVDGRGGRAGWTGVGGGNTAGNRDPRKPTLSWPLFSTQLIIKLNIPVRV